MNKNFKYLLLIPGLISPFLIGCKDNKQTETIDFTLLRNNYKNMLKDTTSTAYFKDKTRQQIRNELKAETISGVETFKFKDIDYVGPFSRSNYPPRQHLDRALALAIVAEDRKDDILKEYVRKLEYHWVFNNYKSPNWYENEIGTIRSLTNVAMFEFDDLNEKGKEAFKGKVRNASIYYHPGLEQHQGANLMDYAQNTFKNGIIEKNSKETDCAFNRLMDEIKEDGKEGFQSEGSYFQHGKLLSTGSYGNVATSKVGDFITTLKGSNYKVPQEKIKIIMNCILVGLKYMIQREYENWMCEGRSFCDKNPYKYNSSSIKKYLDMDEVSKEDKENLANFIENQTSGKPCFNDTRIFPKARIIVSNIDDVYIAFKGCDPTTVNTECLNNENELAYNFSYGMNTAIMQSGMEYHNLSPVCDFSFLPGGVSKDYGFEDLEITETNKFYKTGDRDIFAHIKELGNERFEDKVASSRNDPTRPAPYVYGMADELSSKGVACMFQQGKHSNKMTFSGQEFTVSCFSTKDGMAILGAGMKDLDDPTSKRNVTLQQCVMNSGDTATGDDSPTVKHNYNNPDKDINTNVYYKSLNDSNLKLRQGSVNGNYRRNHSVASSEEVTKNTMITYMPIDANNKYAYSIQTKDDDKFAVVHNDENVQAVKLSNNLIAACFYNEDSSKQVFKYDSGTGEKEYKLTNKFIEGQGAFQVFDIQT